MFEKIKCFILDMDGTIYLGNELFPFTKDFFQMKVDGKLEENIISLPIIHQKASGLILRNLGSLGYQSRKIR